MCMEGQRGLLFGSCEYSHLSCDNIQKITYMRTVISLQGSAFWWGHTSSWHDVTPGWDVTSITIRVKRAGDCKHKSSISFIERWPKRELFKHSNWIFARKCKHLIMLMPQTDLYAQSQCYLRANNKSAITRSKLQPTFFFCIYSCIKLQCLIFSDWRTENWDHYISLLCLPKYVQFSKNIFLWKKWISCTQFACLCVCLVFCVSMGWVYMQRENFKITSDLCQFYNSRVYVKRETQSSSSFRINMNALQSQNTLQPFKEVV